ncbi:MAG TPA: triose-phosphate isomerase, partial [Burkholderiales bacterium]|nr:triose-phosphate isomerase [Burkholderiales bacterium]
DCGVCVPFPYLAQVQSLLAGTRVKWGAQDLSEHTQGAYTGEVAGGMLNDFGCRFVIVGHSERRTLHGEDDSRVARKFSRALAAGLTPILCVGESLRQRDAGITESVVGSQLDAVIEQNGMAAFERAVLAYEPVWAIGTGRTASPEQAQAVHAFIREKISRLDSRVAAELAILYGGSVKASNARALFAMKDIDGGLIGGASLIADEFVGICSGAVV